jgi:cytoskeletal protein CcmA (bactofilin family)
MPDRPSFTLPDGLQLDVTADTLDLKFDGDVTISTTLGRRFGRIEVGGDLTVQLSTSLTGTVRCGGTLSVNGDIDAEHVHAREISLGRQNVKCRTLSADQRITLGAGTIVADVIIAPEIVMDPKAQGRVTVIESQNERGATKIKGGFGLADYEDMFGNADEFLAQRGLRRLDAGGPLASGSAPKPTSPPTRSRAPTPVTTSTVVPDDATQRITRAAPAPAPPRKAAAPAIDEDTEDPVSVSFDDLEPVETAAAADAATNRNDVHQRLVDALGRITACYEGTDLPPAVHELQELVKGKDYDALRQNITEVWNGLLGFHQKRGIRPHHQVTHAFNVINNLVQQ